MLGRAIQHTSENDSDLNLCNELLPRFGTNPTQTCRDHRPNIIVQHKVVFKSTEKCFANKKS